MRGMSIGEVARKMGLRSSAIVYEKLGLIPKAPRLSGRRRYDERVLERLAMVRFAKHVGSASPRLRCCYAGRRPSATRAVALSSPPRKSRRSTQFVVQARTIRKLLSESLDFQCPEIGGTRSCLPAASATSSVAPEASRSRLVQTKAGVG